MSAPRSLSHAEAAQHIARTLGPVLPLCYLEDGVCACGGKYDRDTRAFTPHVGHDLGKAPLSRLVVNGVDDATTNSAKIDLWWRRHPQAGVGLALKPGRVLFVDPDSPEALAEAERQGIAGGMRRESRNVGFLFRRPDDCPIVNISKSADGTDLEIRTDGYAVVWNTHANGSPVRVDLAATLQDALTWAVERLKAKAASKAEQDAVRAARRAERAENGAGSEPLIRLHQRGLRRWSGELVQRKKNGQIDHSDSLYFIGLDHAECGASEAGVRWAVENRDVELGWRKYADRDDADLRYQEIAEKVVAYVVEKQKEPQLTIAKPSDNATIGELRAALEEAEATITRLRRRVLDDDDRLEVLEDVVHSIDDVLNRPNEEMSASEKVALVVTARWLPFHRSKQEANGKPTTIALGYVAKVAGSSKSTVSSVFKRFSSDDPNDGAPFRRRVTRHPKFDENGAPVIDPRTGRQQFESELEITPWGERPSETLRAAVRLAGVQTRPKHGGSQEAADARWGRCPKHDNREVRVKGYCPDCRKVLGEKIVRLAEFDVLNEQVAHSEGTGAMVSNANLIGKQVAHSDHAHGPVERQNVQVVDPAPPLNLLDYAATRPQEAPKPWRCHCGSYERYPRQSGGYRCDGCGDVTLPAMMGAES